MELMEALIAPPRHVITERTRLGVDRLDEVWEGVYHVTPVPSREHGWIASELLSLLSNQAREHQVGTLRYDQAVGSPRDYRVPEWLFLSRGGARLSERGYVRAADLVCEVLSPGDDTWKKKPFYERMGVKELLVIDPKPRRVWLFNLVVGRYVEVEPTRGWVRSESLKAGFRTGQRASKPALLVRLELEARTVAL